MKHKTYEQQPDMMSGDLTSNAVLEEVSSMFSCRLHPYYYSYYSMNTDVAQLATQWDEGDEGGVPSSPALKDHSSTRAELRAGGRRRV